MSHTVVNAVVIRQWGSASRKSVALTLAHHADGDSWSTLLGQQRIADETELSVRQVGRILRELESENLLSREKRALPQRGGRTSDRTILDQSTIAALPLTETGALDLVRMNQKDAMSDKGDGSKRTSEPIQKDTDDHPKGQAMSEEPSESHQLVEPSVIAATPLNELKDVLVEVFGEPPPQHWSLYNRIATWIRDRGGTPELIRFKAGRIAEEWGAKACTVTSLEKHWTRYDAEVGQLSEDTIDKYRAEMRRLQRQRRAEELEAGARGLP